jgi:hypothetical protein
VEQWVQHEQPWLLLWLQIFVEDLVLVPFVLVPALFLRLQQTSWHQSLVWQHQHRKGHHRLRLLEQHKEQRL